LKEEKLLRQHLLRISISETDELQENMLTGRIKDLLVGSISGCCDDDTSPSCRGHPTLSKHSGLITRDEMKAFSEAKSISEDLELTLHWRNIGNGFFPLLLLSCEECNKDEPATYTQAEKPYLLSRECRRDP
jgi:hypothetical protein